MAESLFSAMRAVAAGAVLKPDEEYALRKLFRWYSQRFSTPLHTVDEIPLEDVYRDFWETRAEDLREAIDHAPDENEEHRLKQDLLELLRAVYESPEEARAREIVEEAANAKIADEDDEFLAEVQAQERKRLAAADGPEHKPIETKVPVVPQVPVAFSDSNLAEAETVGPARVPEGVKMTFVDDEEFRKLVDEEEWDVLADPTKKG